VAGGPDVWEIISALRHADGSEASRTAAVGDEFGIHEPQVVLALNYAAAYPDEIHERLHANDRALEEVERITEERQRQLA
jgi:hypothetical protein